MTDHHNMMPAIFNTNTQITLFFNSWTTTTLARYVLTLVFLFLLAWFNRFLGALKSQLENKWISAPPGGDDMSVDDSNDPVEESNPLTHEHEKRNRLVRRGGWIPNGPWSLRRDGVGSVIEVVRALIGYILMLAVMSFNVGVFCAVLAGILMGELLLGRYTHSSAGWLDGACHDG